MKYRVTYCDLIKDEKHVTEVEAKSVFDAIDYVASIVDHPEDVELIEAVPVE